MLVNKSKVTQGKPDMNQEQKADLFQAMHVGAGAFLLPNAWDAVSARIYEEAGFSAIATASAAIAFAHGVADGEKLSRREMITATGRIVRAVSVPVSADMERGYGEASKDVATSVSMLLDAGAIGMNIEDSLDKGTLRPIADMAARIAAARSAAETRGIALVINARTDVFATGGTGEAAFDETVRRANACFDAGADCAFILTQDFEMMARLIPELNGPVNVLAGGPDTPALAALGAMGVRRVSTGPRLMQKLAGGLRGYAQMLQEKGEFGCLDELIPYGEIEGWFSD